MATESTNMDDIMEARRSAIEATIHTVTVEQMNALGEELFPIVDHPWREKFFGFIRENAGATFFHGVTDEGLHVVYCREQEKGVWFLPGSGTGIMQPRGIEMMKQLVGKL